MQSALRDYRAAQLTKIDHDWEFWARREQLPPPGPWRSWVFLGGRGAGKTRAGAEWVSRLARRREARRIALIGPTFHDVREVMVEGQSGLRALGGRRPRYEAGRRRAVWPNGAQAHCFSAEDPDSLRGPQFDAAWADELCFWAYPERTLETLEFGLRLGARPRLMVTTTPRPMPALKRLLGAADCVVTRATTFSNAGNVSPDFIAALEQRWLGDLRHRQELLGELIDDVDGALWRRADIEACRGSDSDLERIVVAVDPPAGSGPGADTCGIVAAGARGAGVERRATVLADASIQGAKPAEWAARAAALAASLRADCIIAEANNGGDMVRQVLQASALDAPVRLVYASRGKRARAEPVAALYPQRRVLHAAGFSALEDEMCAFGAPGFKGSADRVDALVWALSALMLNGEGPRARML